jgi:hypothetical protein
VATIPINALRESIVEVMKAILTLTEVLAPEKQFISCAPRRGVQQDLGEVEPQIKDKKSRPLRGRL